MFEQVLWLFKLDCLLFSDNYYSYINRQKGNEKQSRSKGTRKRKKIKKRRRKIHELKQDWGKSNE